MSWNASTQKPIRKIDVDVEIDKLGQNLVVLEDAAADQIRIAKQAAKLIASNIAGPYLNVSLSGHANGVGWQKKSGMANDAINVSIYQICEDDLKYYQN